MYNLLVTAEDGAWDKPAYEFKLDRAVQEHTVKSISAKYKSFSETTATDLTGFPSLFLYEIGAGDNARIGWIKKIRRRSQSVVIEYEIEKACKKVGLRCLRADNIWKESAIIHDIFNLLYCSCIVVVDFTDKNSNVMYETGIAHTLGRPVIPISQSKNDIPFDLGHHRCLLYSPNKEGLSKMQTALEKRLKTINS